MRQPGETQLHVAARLGSLDIAREILIQFPDLIDSKDKHLKTALHEAAQHARYEMCQLLILNGADVNAIKRADWTPLMLACTKSVPEINLQIVKLLLENGAIVNYKNKDGWTAMHLICRTGDPEILKDLLKHGADTTLRTNNGRTALHIAALHGNIDVVSILLDLGLNLDVQDSCGNTPLHESVLGHRLDICKLLVDKGANISSRNKRGYNMLHLAASQGDSDAIDFVLSNQDWPINETTEDGFTALHCAARNHHRAAFDCLVEKGADPFIIDKCGRDAFQTLNVSP